MIQCDWLEYFYSCSDCSDKKVYGYSMVLSYSRMRYVLLSRSQDIQAFFEGFLGAFEYFGGIPTVIRYDNLKSVVLKRKSPSTTSEFHPAFVDLGIILVSPPASVESTGQRPKAQLNNRTAISKTTSCTAENSTR